ncbi:PREDICTED: fatty acid-binding protein, muscle-like isoform X2 [Nicrophorus vespilloides]|uniref:Fatty acid-binding protein, muscle-like isoform X2 n=1 Tax=Nicrophorus vespilloides TaxID=110193 RepID=A0ABM1MAP2_NICVS|nr:PREDICTED: fatty acid-binding protein, muscle-like isoform X2 [Nicrophorus vespilloides]
MEAFLQKKYKLVNSENFDEFMKAVGVGLVTRKMGNAVSPVVELKMDGDQYVLSSTSTFKNVVTKFKPGVEIDDETPDGRKVKSTYNVNGNVITEKQIDSAGKVTIIDRTWSNDEIKMVLKVDNIVCTRIYKAQA